MENKTIIETLQSIELYKEKLTHLNNLFAYKAPDEAGYTGERPLCVQVSGGSTSVEFYPQTRKQADLVKTLLLSFIEDEITTREKAFFVVCEEEAIKYNNDIADALQLKRSVDEGSVKIIMATKEKSRV